MHCPVCKDKLIATFTRPGKHYRGGVMLCCPRDSRHYRAFLNDPEWVDRAYLIGDPTALIGVDHADRPKN